MYTLKFHVCKDSANRRQYKIKSLLFVFIVEMQPIFSCKGKVSKSKTIQNKKLAFCFYC